MKRGVAVAMSRVGRFSGYLLLCAAIFLIPILSVIQFVHILLPKTPVAAARVVANPVDYKSHRQSAKKSNTSAITQASINRHSVTNTSALILTPAEAQLQAQLRNGTDGSTH